MESWGSIEKANGSYRITEAGLRVLAKAFMHMFALTIGAGLAIGYKARRMLMG